MEEFEFGVVELGILTYIWRRYCGQQCDRTRSVCVLHKRITKLI
jgi:hypothetical protein